MNIQLEFQRIPVTLARTGKSHSRLYALISDGLFTPPIKIGARSAAHPRHEVDAIMAAELNGQTPDQIRALVKNLIAHRKSFLTASRPEVSAA